MEGGGKAVVSREGIIFVSKNEEVRGFSGTKVLVMDPDGSFR